MPYDFDRIIDRSGTFAVKWDAAGGELPMWVADMDFAAAPEVLEAVREREANGVFGYTRFPAELRGAYAHWWKERHGLDVDPDWVLFANGVVPAISSMVRRLTKPREKVLVQPPVYNMFYECITKNDRRVLESPLVLVEGASEGPDSTGGALRYEMDFADLETKLADQECTLMLLCNPQNPSGRIWTAEELARIGELAAANGVLVISDEIHCDLADPGHSYVPFASVSEACLRNSVTCVAPTKSFNLAGLHSSAVFAADEALRSIIREGMDTDGISGVNAFAPAATIAAFEKGGPWLDELCAYVAENKRILADFLAAQLPQLRPVEGPATYLCWVDCRRVTEDDAQLQRFLRSEAKLFVSAGSAYGAAGRGFLRINVACPRSMVEEGLERLKTGVYAFERRANDK